MGPTDLSGSALAAGRLRVALAGNPNSGKTSLFNRLTGQRGKVGNYPGVTVESREADLQLPGHACRLVDVPGTYSLSARSADEEIAMRVLAGLDPGESAPDAVVVVVDGTQLERNLYLALQVIELDVPVLVAVNMADTLAKEGAELDVDRLHADLGVPVVAVSALQDDGIERLRSALDELLGHTDLGRPGWRQTPEDNGLLETLDHLAGELPEGWIPPDAAPGAAARRGRALALWALLSVDDDDELESLPDAFRERVRAAQGELDRSAAEVDQAIIQGRYRWIEERMPRFLREPNERGRSITERLDGVLLSPWIGFPIFLLAMTVVFESLFAWADPAIGAVEGLFGWLGDRLAAVLPDGLLQSFLVDGVLAGVG